MENSEPHELGPGLSSIYDADRFDKWMETDPILPNPQEMFGTAVDSNRMIVYMIYKRLDSEKPWPWIYLRLAWYEVRGYDWRIAKAFD
jgi:hypothetical protein